MRTIYEAYDGTQFNNIEKAFDYEWRELFPNIRIFTHDGRVVNSIFDADVTDYNFIYKVHNKNEKQLVMDYFIQAYGNIAFWDNFQNECSDTEGYFIDTDDGIRYTTEDSLITFLSGELDPTTPLGCELNLAEDEEEKA